MSVVAIGSRSRDVTKERPYMCEGGWRVRASTETAQFFPNRIYVNILAGAAVLVARKSRTGFFHAVSADGLAYLHRRVNDPASWLREAHLMLVSGDFHNPDDIVLLDTLSIDEAIERVAGRTPQSKHLSWGAVHWLCPNSDDDLM